MKPPPSFEKGRGQGGGSGKNNFFELTGNNYKYYIIPASEEIIFKSKPECSIMNYITLCVTC